MENKAQSRLAKMQATINQAAGRQYTFATQKLRNGKVALLCKLKGRGPYQYVTNSSDCSAAIFNTKASAHNAAEDINDNGIENTPYILGQDYIEQL